MRSNTMHFLGLQADNTQAYHFLLEISYMTENCCLAFPCHISKSSVAWTQFCSGGAVAWIGH